MTGGERTAEAGSDGSVVYDVTEGVATIRLNRPEAMNSLDIATKVLLRETVRTAAEDPAVSDTIRRSQANARLAPAPAATPLTAATTGFSMVAMALTIGL